MRFILQGRNIVEEKNVKGMILELYILDTHTHIRARATYINMKLPALPLCIAYKYLTINQNVNFKTSTVIFCSIIKRMYNYFHQRDYFSDQLPQFLQH